MQRRTPTNSTKCWVRPAVVDGWFACRLLLLRRIARAQWALASTAPRSATQLRVELQRCTKGARC